MSAQVTTTATIMAVDATGPAGAPLDQLIGEHGGQVLSDDGAVVIAAFEAASQAVVAASAWQACRAGVSRIGVAAGDVTWEGQACSGTPVDAATTLQAAAWPGQILVSQAVRILAGDRAGDRYEPIGALALAGGPGVVETFAVGWQPSEARPGGTIERPPMPLALAETGGHAFVGRVDAMASLDRAWADAARETGRIVLLGGEAGAGKTRLAAEFARRVHASGAAVLHGGCDDDLALPYQPWVQALDPVLPALVRSTDGLSPGLAPLAPLLANAERFVPTGSTSVSDDPDAERYRRYGAFSLLLDAAASQWPTLLVLDDLHWAGPQTLALVRHLPRVGLPRGLMIVATFRDTGDELTEPLRSCLADLHRVDGAARLRVGGLDLASVERFVASAAGGDLDDRLRRVAGALAERTGGNAFYVGELWDHLVAVGAVTSVGDRFVVRSEAAAFDVPDSVREVVAARLARLSATSRAVVEIAAVAGLRVDLAVLARAVDDAVAGSGDLGRATDEVVDAGLLITTSGPRLTFQFTHALARDTVEASIAPMARRHLHLAVAHAIELTHEADLRPVLVDLAKHYAAAVPIGPMDKALHFGRRAASQAFGAAAYDEAVAHLDVLLALSPGPAERAEILVELGTTHLRRGFDSSSRDVFGEAFELAAELGAVDIVANAAVGFESATHFPGLPGGPAVEVLHRALELAGDTDPARQARLRASYGRALAIAGRWREGVAMGELAMDQARALDDPTSLVVALQALLTAVDDPPRQLAIAKELAALADPLGDTWSATYASGNAFRAYVQLGRFDDAMPYLDRHRALSASGRFSTFQFMSHSFDVVVALASGAFDAAEAAAERAEDLAAANGSPFGEGVYGMQMFAIRRAQGRLNEVAPVLQLLADRPDASATWRPGLAALYVELDQLDDARRVFDALAPARFADVARDAIWPACLTFLAETAVAVGGPQDGQVLYEELSPMRGQNLMAGFTMCFGPADRLLGALAAKLGRHDDAEAHFRTAMDMATSSRSPVWTAEVEHDWAVALVARGERAPAVDLAARASSTAERLGMRRLAARSSALCSSVVATVARARPDQLSEREVEVLACVASGWSNREIGARLFISQNTVANHVRAILRKTGCANRTEAATYAVRRGLAEP